MHRERNAVDSKDEGLTGSTLKDHEVKFKAWKYVITNQTRGALMRPGAIVNSGN